MPCVPSRPLRQFWAGRSCFLPCDGPPSHPCLAPLAKTWRLQQPFGALRRPGEPSRRRRCPRLGGAAQLGTAGSCGAGSAGTWLTKGGTCSAMAPGKAGSCWQALLAQLSPACLPLPKEVADLRSLRLIWLRAKRASGRGTLCPAASKCTDSSEGAVGDL